MQRRDFLKTAGLATGAALAGAPRVHTDHHIDKLPFVGSMFRRQNGQLVLMGRGVTSSISDNGGRSWSPPKPLLNAGEPVRADGDVVGLLRLASGKVALSYGRSDQDGKRRRHGIFLRTSKDDGRTWSDESTLTPLPADDLSALHASMVQLRSGRLIVPAYARFSHRYAGRRRGLGSTWIPEYRTTVMLVSDDEGKTWQYSGGLYLWKDLGHGGLVGCGEASVAETQDGRLMMLASSTNMRILKSYSQDSGDTWSYVELTDLCTSDAPIRLVRHPETDDLLLVWNQASAREQRNGFGRGRLSMAVSHDSGKTWERSESLETSPGMASVSRVTDTEPPGFVREGENTFPGQVPDKTIRGIVCSSRPNVNFLDGMTCVDYSRWFTPNLWASESERRDMEQKVQVVSTA